MMVWLNGSQQCYFTFVPVNTWINDHDDAGKPLCYVIYNQDFNNLLLNNQGHHLSPAISPWVGKMSTGDDWPLLRKKQLVVRSCSPVTRTAKTLAVNRAGHLTEIGYMPHVGPLIPSLPHLLLYLLVSFPFLPFSFFIHASSIFLLFIPSHSTRIVPLRFHARMS